VILTVPDECSVIQKEDPWEEVPLSVFCFLFLHSVIRDLHFRIDNIIVTITVNLKLDRSTETS
jgi:hypothetical protein